MTTISSPLAVNWALSTVSGYGIYGIQIILQYLRRGGLAKDCILTGNLSVMALPPLERAKLASILDLGTKITALRKKSPLEELVFKHAVLHGCGNNFLYFPGTENVWGKPNVACAAIENIACTESGRAYSKKYDMFIAISKWNAEYLKSLDIGPVHLCYQGIDPALFHPGQGTGLFRDRFVIFSGGKFEYRKGQDIVVAAFKRFYQKHPEALLVTCWQNLLKPDAEVFSLSGHCDGVPASREEPFGLHITPWLMKQGLPPDSFVDLPFTHNLMMPSVLRDCDMAVFPNRCEGGTNLVAMEAMACAVPTYVSYNTGQKDLVDLIGCKAFRHQSAVKSTPAMQTVQDWGETDVEEVLAAMEQVYSDRITARKEADALALKMREWSWSGLNEKLLGIVCDSRASF